MSMPEMANQIRALSIGFNLTDLSSPRIRMRIQPTSVRMRTIVKFKPTTITRSPIVM